VKAGSKLERILQSGGFAVTGEINPPRSADGDFIRHRARSLASVLDAANITDNQTAMVRLSSHAAGRLILEEGLEPIVQMTCRDRNRIALQSDILGASALGIRNVLCLTGDHQKFGDHPAARGVFDIDSVQLIQMMAKMRDEGRFLSGKKLMNKIKEPGILPKLFIGGAANPYGEPREMALLKLLKKTAAGADFLQTQPIFDMKLFKQWLKRVIDLGLHEKLFILAGIMPVRSHKALVYMRDNVLGIRIDAELIARLESAKHPDEEGLKISVEQIHMLKEMKAIHGIHIMAVLWEEIVPSLIEASGLLPRPVVAVE
jgi:methylenetetrahydrofolate reductase (NADPH)